MVISKYLHLLHLLHHHSHGPSDEQLPSYLLVTIVHVSVLHHGIDQSLNLLLLLLRQIPLFVVIARNLCHYLHHHHSRGPSDVQHLCDQLHSAAHDFVHHDYHALCCVHLRTHLLLL